MGVMIHRLPQVLVFDFVFETAKETLPQLLAAIAAEPVEFVQLLLHAGQEPPEEEGAHPGEYPHQ